MHPRRPFDQDVTGRPRIRGHRVVGPLVATETDRHFVITAFMMIATTVISIVLSIAAAAAQYMAQQQAAEANRKNQEAQMRAQDAAIAANAALANKAYMENTKALQERQVQADEAAANKQQQVGVQTAQAKSTALTAAGEAGVSGLNVNALMSDFTRQEADYRFQSDTQLGHEHDQTNAEISAAQIQGEGRTQSMKPFQTTPIQYPSLLGAGLRVGADVAGQAANAYRSTPVTPSTNYGAGPKAGWASQPGYGYD
jgi:hypothetical protein